MESVLHQKTQPERHLGFGGKVPFLFSLFCCRITYLVAKITANNRVDLINTTCATLVGSLLFGSSCNRYCHILQYCRKLCTVFEVSLTL